MQIMYCCVALDGFPYVAVHGVYNYPSHVIISSRTMCDQKLKKKGGSLSCSIKQKVKDATLWVYLAIE